MKSSGRAHDAGHGADGPFEALDGLGAPLDADSELGRLLVELWPDLHLTRAKRLPWQARFAELRPATVAA
jgi:hypothetical protein